MKVQDILDVVHVVKTHLTKARQLQDMLRSFEVINCCSILKRILSFPICSSQARDRNLAELNCSRVSLLSILIVLTMISVGLLQVFMIRNLFETNPKGHKVWEKLSKLIGQ